MTVVQRKQFTRALRMVLKDYEHERSEYIKWSTIAGLTQLEAEREWDELQTEEEEAER